MQSARRTHHLLILFRHFLRFCLSLIFLHFLTLAFVWAPSSPLGGGGVTVGGVPGATKTPWEAPWPSGSGQVSVGRGRSQPSPRAPAAKTEPIKQAGVAYPFSTVREVIGNMMRRV